MGDKPATAGGYSSEQAMLVRAACLYVATKLGDFLDPEGIGPRRAAEFQVGRRDDEIQADVVGFVGRLLRACEQG